MTRGAQSRPAGRGLAALVMLSWLFLGACERGPGAPDGGSPDGGGFSWPDGGVALDAGGGLLAVLVGDTARVLGPGIDLEVSPVPVSALGIAPGGPAFPGVSLVNHTGADLTLWPLSGTYFSFGRYWYGTFSVSVPAMGTATTGWVFEAGLPLGEYQDQVSLAFEDGAWFTLPAVASVVDGGVCGDSPCNAPPQCYPPTWGYCRTQVSRGPSWNIECIYSTQGGTSQEGKACDAGNPCIGGAVCTGGPEPVCHGQPLVGTPCALADPCVVNPVCSQYGSCLGTPRCNTPPPPTCTDAHTLTTYGVYNACRADGGCEYPQSQQTCLNACDGGTCT